MHNEDIDSHLHCNDGDVVFTKDFYSKKEKRKLSTKEFENKTKPLQEVN